MAFNGRLTRWQCSRLLRDVQQPFSKNTGRGTNFPVQKPQVGDNTSKSPTHVDDGNSNIFFPKIISFRNDSYPHPSQQASSESAIEYLHYLPPQNRLRQRLLSLSKSCHNWQNNKSESRWRSELLTSQKNRKQILKTQTEITLHSYIGTSPPINF